jgi:cytochrome P450
VTSAEGPPQGGAPGTDLTDLRDYRDGFPHDLFTELRTRGAVHWHEPAVIREDLPAEGFWSVVRHAEVQQANRDWETFSAAESVSIYRDAELAGRTLVSMDPPDHTRLRRLITAGFTPRMIKGLEAHIESRASEILVRACEAGTCDFVRDVAYQLPMHVIADIVGIPQADRPWVFELTELTMKARDPQSPHTRQDQLDAQGELFAYAVELTSQKRRWPRDDVWSLIANAELRDPDGTTHRLDGMELEMFFIILAVAGSETTRNALSLGLLALHENPDQLAALRNDPGSSATAVDEVLRWASPVLYFARTATRDTCLGGLEIGAGDRVVLWYPSANRDESVFADPFRFDIRRNPNPHVSFGGGGPHHCLGAHLARREIDVLLTQLFGRYDVEVLGGPSWSGAGPLTNVGVSVESLPVRLTPRPS